MSKFLTAPVPSKKMPGGIPYIISNELAERFSFYGMKGILIAFMGMYLYLLKADPNAAPMSDAVAIEWYHTFTFWVYLTPLAGALLADVLIGKYLTIMILSIVYCLGHGALALMGAVDFAAFGFDPAEFFFIFGLSLIAIGSGGIKPCVSAHVGDQFGKSNAYLLAKVIGWFYLSINVGASLSNFLTPWLLEWYGPHWAFGVPGVLMALATLVFWLGRNKFVHVPPGGIKFFKEVFSRAGISAVAKLSIIYIFVAVFWALFDQTGSSWVLQGYNMDLNLLGIELLPSQVQFVNPLMILILVPLFFYVIYPLINKVFTLTPIRKIAIGLFVMVPGFGVVAIAQSWIDQGQVPSIAWQVLAYSILTASEVMVSITCLEFSYTQAPRKMKSWIMAIFLCSVSIGNLFTMVVASNIQVPLGTPQASEAASKVMGAIADGKSPEQVQQLLDSDFKTPMKYDNGTEEGFSLSMPWPNFEGGDQITISYDEEGKESGIDGKGFDAVREATERIKKLWEKDQDELPSADVGSAAIADLKDPWGNALSYHVINGTQARVTSDGPDGKPLTSDNINDTITIIPPATAEDAMSWRQKRIAELAKRYGTKKEAEDAEGNTFSQSLVVGGGETLEGASYFWFYVIVMLVTAILFVPVAFLYKPKEYLQEEADVDEMESVSGAIGDQ